MHSTRGFLGWVERAAPGIEAYEGYRRRLGLAILVAADVVRTVALDNTLRGVAGVGLLVIVRTFLSWSLIVKVEGR